MLVVKKLVLTNVSMVVKLYFGVKKASHKAKNNPALSFFFQILRCIYNIYI